MEQAELTSDLIYLSGAGTPSFPALASHRFADTLAVQTVKHLRERRILPERLLLKKIRATEADPHDLYYEVLFLCDFTENGRKKCGLFVLKCACELDDAFRSTRILSVSPFSRSYTPSAGLPNDLVPVLLQEALDRTAEEILSAYYPEALEGAPVDAEKLAERIGLRVEAAPPCSDPNMFGEVFFENTSDAVPARETGILKIRSVERGTVLVRTVSKGPNIDRAIQNNTILHECVHWLLHRPAFLLHGIWHPENRSIILKDGLPESSPECLSSVRRMERQANALSPRLLMPAAPVRLRTARLLERYASLPEEKRAVAVIRDLCSYYGASRRLAEIRLSELGFGNLVLSGSFQKKKRYEIGPADAVREFLRNPAFQKALFSGRYRYVDRSFVFADDGFFTLSENGVRHLAEHVRKHRDLYCLPFTETKKYLPSSLGMHRYASVEQVFLPRPLPDMKTMADSAMTVSRILRSLPSGFSDTLVAHMKRKHITSEALSEASCISVRQLARLRNGQFREIPLPTAVALCIGLKLHPLLSRDLVKKAGIRFNDSAEHAGFQILLLCMTDRTIYECDRFLSELGIPPLEKRER